MKNTFSTTESGLRKKHTLYLLGNPNVGKSTVFNALTGLRQHTGNWAGKTVDVCFGKYSYENVDYDVIDLPGTHSVSTCFDEECVTTHSIDANNKSENTYKDSTTIIFVDATAVKRGITLALEYLEHPRFKYTKSAILCLNLWDIAKKRGTEIDTERLSKILGIPVITVSARKRSDINKLKRTISDIAVSKPKYCEYAGDAPKSSRESITAYASKICDECIVHTYNPLSGRGHSFDKIITSKAVGIPIMILCLGIVLWITIKGANYPSDMLSAFFAYLGPKFKQCLITLRLPDFLVGMIADGIYGTVTWIIAVMLPPMAIFFPMFTILEDLGFLPRIAFNLDKCYAKTNMSGKQCLTQCMGLGCNAVGVSGARIMPSEKQRIISILTNCFMPCNGRFALLITLSSIFIGGAVAQKYSSFVSMITVLLLIILSVLITWAVSYVLSVTLYKDNNEIFSLELPEYRRPEIVKTLTISLISRTFAIIGRALLVSAPMGAVIWILANIHIGDISCLTAISQALNPIGNFLGVDGFILFAFLLSLPANEITLPILIMAYLSTGTMSDASDINALKSIFEANSWTILTAVNMMILTLYHSPCVTTLMTIYHETHSVKKLALSVALPCTVGILLCLFTKLIFTIIRII